MLPKMKITSSFCPPSPFLTVLLVGLYTEEQLLRLSENNLLKAPGDSWWYRVEKLLAAAVGEGQHGQEVGLSGWEERGKGVSSDLHLAREASFAELIRGTKILGEGGPEQR